MMTREKDGKEERQNGGTLSKQPHVDDPSRDLINDSISADACLFGILSTLSLLLGDGGLQHRKLLCCFCSKAAGMPWWHRRARLLL
jgi:hypothetical protein